MNELPEVMDTVNGEPLRACPACEGAGDVSTPLFDGTVIEFPCRRCGGSGTMPYGGMF